MRKIVFLSTLYFLLSIFLIGCATGPLAPMGRVKATVVIDGVHYISAQALSQTYNLDYHWDAIVRKVTLKRDDKELRAAVNSSCALLNNQVHTMEREARFYQGEVVIPRSFARKAVEPFFRERYIGTKEIPIAFGPIKKVIIDPGHGGKDPGAVGIRGLMEKDVVLDIAKRLKRKLNAAGINVILTRDRDEFISLARRSKIANNARDVDFFISIHANASRSRWVSGVEVFYLSESIDDNLRSFKAAKNYDLNLKERFSGKDTAAILWDLIYNDNRRSSIELAGCILGSLSKNLSQRNRGKKPARFYVLKGTNIPAILIEVGFISNSRDEKKLRNSSYRDRVAQAVIQGLIRYNRQKYRLASRDAKTR